MVGIYKITNPKGAVYIGQSWNVERRLKSYTKSSGAKGQHRLYNSLNKYGRENHLYDIIVELPNDISQDILDIHEVLYINQYRDCRIESLNIRGAGSRGKFSEESRIKLSNSKKGKKKPASFFEKVVGRKLSAEHKANLSKVKSGKSRKARTSAIKDKISKSLKGHNTSIETRVKISNSLSKQVIIMNNNESIIFKSCTELANYFQIKRHMVYYYISNVKSYKGYSIQKVA